MNIHTKAFEIVITYNCPFDPNDPTQYVLHLKTPKSGSWRF